MDLNHDLLPAPAIPPLSMASKSINQAPTISCSSVDNPINPPIELVKDLVIAPPSSQHISKKTKCNRLTNEFHKKFYAQGKSCNFFLQKYLPSLDTTMHDVLEEVVAHNEVKLHDFDDSIHILDCILINLDEDDTIDDTDDVNDEYETIDIDIDLPNILSSQLTLTPSIKHCDSQ